MSEPTTTPCGGCGATEERQRCIGCRHNFSAQQTTPCGGCGATEERQRCIGCLHNFSAQQTTGRDWLAEEIARASAVVASWSPERQAAMRAQCAPPPPDPCHHSARCDEAQTCVGGCVYAR